MNSIRKPTRSADLAAAVRGPTAVYLAIAIPLWTLVVWGAFFDQAATHLMGSDFWEHSAVLKAWIADLWRPDNPQLTTANSSRYFTPFFFLVAALSRALGLDPFQAMGLAGTLSITLFFLAVPLFFNRLFSSRWAGPIGLIVMLMGWGSGWLWSNLYQLRALFYVVAYQSFFAISLSLVAFRLMLGVLRREGFAPLYFSGLVVVVGLVFTVHPLTGLFAVATLFSLAVGEHSVSARRRLLSLVGVALGLGLTAFWPFFSVWGLVLGEGATMAGGSTGPHAIAAQPDRFAKLFDIHPFYAPVQVLITFGPLLGGVPVIAFLALARKYLFVPLGAVFMLIPYFGKLLFPVPLGHRFLLYFAFFCQVALVWLMLHWLTAEDGARQRRRLILRGAAVTTLVLMASWNLALTGAELAGYHLDAAGQMLPRFALRSNLVERYEKLASLLPPDAVVMAQRLEGWPLPTFAGKVVALWHPNPLVHDSAERARDVKAFFSPLTDNAQRIALLRKYGATYAFFAPRTLPRAVTHAIRQLAAGYAYDGTFVLVKLRSTGAAS